MSRRPVVLLYESIHAEALELLRQRAEVVFAESLDEHYLRSAVADVDAIIIRANGRVTRPIMEAAPRLRVVGRHGVGVENIDRQAAAELGIVVVNTPEANVESVAEHCVGMMITLAKRMLPADRSLRAGDWDARYRLTGSELAGKALGVVGFGRIGQRLAGVCHLAFGMPVLYYDVLDYPKAAAELNARRASLYEVLAAADFVSVHVPLVPATHGLIGARELHAMQPHACLINTARGPVVDQAALVRALREGWIAGAGLDVFDPEPLPPDSPLLELDNVVLSPHMAAHTEEALLRMAMVVKDILAVVEGHSPQNAVPAPA
jgi:D-3-phosphoglycerate dehydrogenase